MSNYKFLKIFKENDVLYVGLNRPESKNAFNEFLIEELTNAFSNLPEDIICVVLYGEGDSFCAGADLDWMKRMGESSFEDKFYITANGFSYNPNYLIIYKPFLKVDSIKLFDEDLGVGPCLVF